MKFEVQVLSLKKHDHKVLGRDLPTAVIHHKGFIDHNLGSNHPERPERLISIMKMLERICHEPSISMIEANYASKDDLLRVHTEDYVERIEDMSRIGGLLTLDTPIPNGTFEKGLLAAGGAILAGEIVAKGDFDNSFALTRPPGHHAGRDFGGGFCFFNNIAIMIAYLKAKKNIRRFMVLDWDVHHGNGTQDIFYADPSVLYFSTHQTPLYPGTGKSDEIGVGEGEGYTVNFPLPVGTSGEAFLHVLREILGPLTEEFKPEMICVSAGYDAYFNDPLANLRFTINTYSDATMMVKEEARILCDGKIAILLEGGYNLEAVSYGVLSTISTLAALRKVEEPYPPPKQELGESIEGKVSSLKNLLSGHWTCFR